MLDEQTGFNVGLFNGFMNIVVFIIHVSQTILRKPRNTLEHNTDNRI